MTAIRGVDLAGRPIMAVPYCVWDNRDPGPMAVWMLQDGKSRSVDPDDPTWLGKLYRTLDPETLGPSTPVPPAELATPSASHCCPTDTPGAMNDRVEPKDSSDRSIPRTSFWNHRGTREWVQYDFEEPRTVSSVSVYWFDDGRQGWDCRVPKSWRVLSRDGEEWKPVETRDAYATARDQYNHVMFTPVRTKALRLEIQLAEPWSGGILEWQVR